MAYPCGLLIKNATRLRHRVFQWLDLPAMLTETPDLQAALCFKNWKARHYVAIIKSNDRPMG
jgi:hypothetical protein